MSKAAPNCLPTKKLMNLKAPTPVAGSTPLSAEATPFIPGQGMARAAPNVMPPATLAGNKQTPKANNTTTNSNASASNASMSSKEASTPSRQHTDPALNINTRESPLSSAASPYTPTNPKIAAKFPASPNSAAAAANNNSSNSAAATATTITTNNAGATSDPDTSATVPEVEIPPAEPADWSNSRLPKLFSCHNTAAKATTSAILLHSQWDLYADDHNSGSTGTPLSPNSFPFDPVLIRSIGDVEQFWRLMRYTPPPSACSSPFTYSFFRHEIRPEWEHSRNKKGGTISIVIFDRDRPGLNDPAVADDVFMATLVGMVGESFSECAGTVNGVMLKVRQNKPITMQIWTSHSDFTRLKAFGNSLRDTLSKVMEAKFLQKLEYFSHQQKQDTGNTLASRAKGMTKIKADLTI